MGCLRNRDKEAVKLRLTSPSYNGEGIPPDGFGYVIGPASMNPTAEIRELVFPCRGGKFDKCIIKITRGDPDQSKATWHWDGNREEPTITPSIGCDHRCGWHGNITKGEVAP